MVLMISDVFFSERLAVYASFLLKTRVCFVDGRGYGTLARRSALSVARILLAVGTALLEFSSVCKAFICYSLGGISPTLFATPGNAVSVFFLSPSRKASPSPSRRSSKAFPEGSPEAQPDSPQTQLHGSSQRVPSEALLKPSLDGGGPMLILPSHDISQHAT